MRELQHTFIVNLPTAQSLKSLIYHQLHILNESSQIIFSAPTGYWN